MAVSFASRAARLSHVYWLGGGSGAGKSTVARRFAAQYELQYYSTDQAMAAHGRRSSPGNCPLMAAFGQMDMDERWVNRTPETMLATFHWFQGEGFALIIEDLLALPADRPIIVECFRLLPNLVKPWLQDPHRGIWLIPTPKFRATAFESRGTLWEIANKTSNPDQALTNLLERDHLFTQRVKQEAKTAGLPTLLVDQRLSEDALVSRIARQFRL